MQVRGEGNRESKIWIIGEAPGETEERLGRPFVGGAGGVLDKVLSETGIRRGETYIDNVIQSRPPKNDFSLYYADKQRKVPTAALLDAHVRIKDLVAQYKPNVVIALGNEALFALTGKKNITVQRGSILGCRGTKVIPTIHPAMVMRQYEYYPLVVMDINRAKREALTPNFPDSYRDSFIINPTYEKVMATLDFLEQQPMVAFDIETDCQQIVCIGFGWSKQDSICIPIFYPSQASIPQNWWTPTEEVAIVQRIKKLFLNPNIKFIAQNAQFDMTYLHDKWGVEVPGLWMDTMVAFHCCYPELKKGLGFINSIYTNRPYYKDMPGSGGPDVLWKYNCLDTVVTYECALEIEKELKEFQTEDFYRHNSHKLINPLIQMQNRGIRIDVELREKIDANLTKDEARMVDLLYRAVGHDLNPNSSKQMVEFLYNELKLPPQFNPKTKALTADEEALEFLSKRFDSPIFRLVMDIRKVRKLLSTYVRAELDPDGRMRCSYVITGTETGRLSARENVYGRGTNLQNVPRGELIRSMFIPDAGKYFVNADLSQAEARVVAYIAREERLQAVFERATGDIHKQNAAMVFNKRVEDVSEEERQLAKTLVHAANYGIGVRKFAQHIGRSDEDARSLLNQYYAMYPSIKRWHLEVEERLSRSRVLRTPLGRARFFFGRWGQDLVREGVAYVPQSTVSDILNLGLIRAWENLPPGWELLMQVHDSVLMQVPVGTDPMHIKKFVQHYFEIPIQIGEKTMIIPTDIKVGENWGKLHKMEV